MEKTRSKEQPVLIRAAFLAACALAFAAAAANLRVDNAVLTLYNSDSAVPVLMSNQDGLSWFDVYYWGQDRFGSLPFLLARAFTAVGGFYWTPQAMQIYLLCWLAAAVFLFALLFPGIRGSAAAAFAAGAMMVPHFRLHLFEIAQFFPWQLPVLFAAMLAVRTAQARRQKQSLWFTLAAFLSFLAVWASPMNLIFLLAFALIEAGITQKITRESGGPFHQAWPSALAGIAAIAAGAAGERLLRFQYHRNALALYGNEYRTMSWINRREIPEALGAIIDRLTSDPWMLAADLAGIAAVVYLGYVAWRGGGRMHPALRTALALGIAGLAQIPIIALVHHFVVSGYPARFFFLTHAGLFCAAALTGLWLLERALKRHNRWTAFLILASILLLPAYKKNPEFSRMEQAAAEICKDKAGLLLGTYWHVYLYASLARQCAEPLPLDGVNRTPWLMPLLRGESVLISSSAETAPGWTGEYLGHTIEQMTPWLQIQGPLPGDGEGTALHKARFTKHAGLR